MADLLTLAVGDRVLVGDEDDTWDAEVASLVTRSGRPAAIVEWLVPAPDSTATDLCQAVCDLETGHELDTPEGALPVRVLGRPL